MSDFDPAHLLADLHLNGIDYRRISANLSALAALIIAREIGTRAARWDIGSNIDGYDASVSADENFGRLQNFALQQYSDEESELFQNGWFAEHLFNLGVVQGYTGINMRSPEVMTALAQAYWDTTQSLFREHEAENVPSTEATF